MTEPQKTDHWALLASNLGAEPARKCRRSAGSRRNNGRWSARASGVRGPVAAPAVVASGAKPACRRAAPPMPRLGNNWRATWELPSSSATTAGCKCAVSRRGAACRAFALIPALSRSKRGVPRSDASGTARGGRGSGSGDAGLGRLGAGGDGAGIVRAARALDIMDETADEFGDEESDEAARSDTGGAEPPTSSAGADSESATEERRSRRRRRRGRGRGTGARGGSADHATWRRR